MLTRDRPVGHVGVLAAEGSPPTRTKSYRIGHNAGQLLTGTLPGADVSLRNDALPGCPMGHGDRSTWLPCSPLPDRLAAADARRYHGSPRPKELAALPKLAAF